MKNFGKCPLETENLLGKKSGLGSDDSRRYMAFLI